MKKVLIALVVISGGLIAVSAGVYLLIIAASIVSYNRSTLSLSIAVVTYIAFRVIAKWTIKD
jgi:hypothetical protein